MKRFFAALLAALMVFSLVTIPAVAEGEVVFEVPTVNAQPGDTVSIPVTLTGSNTAHCQIHTDLGALALKISTQTAYDLLLNLGGSGYRIRTRQG